MEVFLIFCLQHKRHDYIKIKEIKVTALQTRALFSQRFHVVNHYRIDFTFVSQIHTYTSLVQTSTSTPQYDPR